MIVEAALGLFYNATILLSLGVLYLLSPSGREERSIGRKLGEGVAIGLLGVALVLTHWAPSPGLFLDARSVLLVISGLYFGPVPSLVAAGVVSAYRIAEGGVGTVAGIAIIVSSVTIGLLWRRHLPARTGWWDLLVLGLVTHLAMILCLLAMPLETALPTITLTALPVLAIYSPVTMLLGRLLELQRERQLSIQEAQRSARRLEAMLKNAWGILNVIDSEGLCSFVSPPVKPILGYDPEEIVGQDFMDLVHPEDRPHAADRYQRLLSRPGSMDRMEVRLRHKDGHWIWAENVGQNRLDDPDLRAVVVNTRDITASKEAREALAGSEQEYRTLVEEIPDIILRFDPEGRHLFASRNVEEIAGIPAEAFIGKTHAEMGFSPELCRFWEGKIREVVDSGLPVQSQFWYQAAGGRIFLDWRLLPESTPEGEVRSVFSISRDITREHEAEEKLRGQRERLANIIEGTGVGTWEWNILTGETVFDERWAEILGYTLEELEPTSIETWRRLTHPEDLARAQRRLGAHVSGEEEAYSCEFRMRHRDGRWVWILDRGKVTKRTEEGRPLRMFGTHQDIDARKEAEREIREREEHQRSLLNSSPMAIFTLSREGVVGSWNPAAEEIFGWTAREAVGRVIPVVREEEFEELRDLIERVWSGEIIRDMEVLRHRKDGSILTVNLSAAPIRGPGGETVSVMAVLADITEHRRAEAALEEERALLGQIMASSPMGICLFDTRGRFLFINAAAQAILRLGSEEGIGKSVEELGIQALDSDGSELDGQPASQKVLQTGESLTGLRRILILSDGSRVAAQLNVAPVRDAEGRPRAVIMLFEDITDRVQEQAMREEMEAELRQAQRLEAIGRLAGGVAHDFNNMLAVIMSATEMALPEVEAGSSLYEDLQHITQAAERSADLTRQLLAFSRKQIVRPRVLDLNEVIQVQEKMLRRLIGEDIQIRLRLQEELWKVRMDPSQVDQILANLLVNARDAIPGVGRVSIETENVFLDQDHARPGMPVTDGGYILLSVSDTGVGMDRETQDRIFEPFFTTKDREKGTGLGLSTVYGIVQQASGVIHVYSEEGGGTTFRIYLPRWEGEGEESENSAIHSLRGTETVLVVEDEPSILSLAQRFLEEQGYTVMTARTPMEALGLVHEHPGTIHLLLTDVVMPGMNGKQLQARIVEILPGIRTLFMSGYTADVIAQRGVLEEDVEFIQKPFSMTTLSQRVREVLDRD